VFLKNSAEAIWQIAPVRPNENTPEGTFFILTAASTLCALSNQTVNALTPGDKRRMVWTDSIITAGQTFYFPRKYKIKTGTPVLEYTMVLRLAEQYLVRSEARAQLNKLAAALSDLNLVRNRAGLPNSNATDKASLLNAILQERFTEYFAEWGHRWLDLKRTGSADSVLNTLKAPNWQSTDGLYPIPQTEIQNDPQLTQNPGY